MTRKTYPLFLLFGLLLTIASCNRDRIDFPTDPVNLNETGYLEFANLHVGVSPDTETLVGGGTQTKATSRTTEEADGSYRMTVTNTSTEEAAWEGSYSELKALGAPLELAPGRYRITATSPGEVEPVAWESPSYAGSTECTVVKKETATVNDLVCTLSNIKTTVELSADLKALFLNDGSNDLKTTVSLGEASQIFSRDEQRAAYFRPEAGTNELTIELSGSYNVNGEGEEPEYQPITMTQKIPDVKAGQWRRIAISIEHATEGNVKFVVTVETWVYDDPIDVDVMSSSYTFGEEEIPDTDDEVSDPDGPQLSMGGGHDISAPFILSESIFDFDFTPVRCNDLISLTATPKASATITEAYCLFDSDNADFLAALEQAGYADHRVALWPESQASDYVIVRTDATGNLLIKVNDAGMYGLYTYKGTHTAKIVVTDSENRRTYTTLTLTATQSAGGNGPSVTGLNGFDFNTRYTISPSDNPPMQAALEVTSATGITGFEIDILGGEVLPDDALQMLDLASHMDLLHPASDAMKSRLQELGFLPSDGSSLEGATQAKFDISEFIPAMTALDGTGDCDFRLTVTDASGTTEKTMKFHVVH